MMHKTCWQRQETLAEGEVERLQVDELLKAFREQGVKISIFEHEIEDVGSL